MDCANVFETSVKIENFKLVFACFNTNIKFFFFKKRRENINLICNFLEIKKYLKKCAKFTRKKVKYIANIHFVLFSVSFLIHPNQYIYFYLC